MLTRLSLGSKRVSSPAYRTQTTKNLRQRNLSTVPSLQIFQNALKNQKRTAIINNPDVFNPKSHLKFTYADLLEHSEVLEKEITASLNSTGDKEPARIALLCDAGYDYVRSQYAIWRSQSVFVPLCTTHPPSEMEYVLQNAEVKVALCDEKHWSVFEPLAKKNGVKLIKLNASKPEFSEVKGNPKNYQVSNQLPGMIIYTSGTTGKPKGVVTTHENIQAQIESMIKPWGWTENDHILHVLPLHHLHGIVNILGCSTFAGATCEMMPRFDVKQVWNRFLQRGKDPNDTLNLFMAVPTVYSRLLHELDDSFADKKAELRKICEKDFRLMVSGSAALPESTMLKWEEASGHRLLERYGMSEIGMALSNPLHGKRIAGAVGLPLPGVEVRIVDEKTGKEAAPGESGEVRVRGKTVFQSYWKKPEATAETFDEQGWFKTGDIGVFKPDENTYRLLGRASVDIIKSGGYKISALDIERELLEHPKIQEIAVVGLPDEEWGQVIAAIAVLKKGETLDLEGIKTWGKDKLAKYKIPRKLLVVDSIPKNAMGKINKKELVKVFNK